MIASMTLWLADWSNEDDTVGGHTLVDAEPEARRLAAEFVSDGAARSLVAPARLCDEDDPDLYRYDNDYERYFALSGPVEVLEREDPR